MDDITGLPALEAFVAALRMKTSDLPFIADAEKFLSRAQKGTGFTIEVDLGDDDDIAVVSGNHSVVTWDGDYLLDPVHGNPMSGRYLKNLSYASRSAKLTLDLSNGDVVTITITGLAGARPKPLMTSTLPIAV